MYTFLSAFPGKRMFREFLKKGIGTALFLGALFNGTVHAQGNLVVFPRRLIFESKGTIQEFTLGNTGKDSATYEITMIQMRMEKNGSFQEIQNPDSGQHFASPYLRYYPQRIILGPDETQKIRVEIRAGAPLEAGEYRSHLSFKAISTERIPANTEEGNASGIISVQIIPYFGISVPVIIRAGDIKGEVSIDHVKILSRNDEFLTLNMTLNRSGAASVYGSVLVNYISLSGHKSILTILDGFAVYTPNRERNLSISLPVTPQSDLRSGTLEILYKSSPGVKQETFAVARLRL